jgi:hypothetical protein
MERDQRKIEKHTASHKQSIHDKHSRLHEEDGPKNYETSVKTKPANERAPQAKETNGNHPQQKIVPQSWLDSETGTTRRNRREVVGLA